MRIDDIKHIKYEQITVGNFQYKRYNDGTWTYEYAYRECEVDDELRVELEQAYQEYLKENQDEKTNM